jgi:hypothetical protein
MASMEEIELQRYRGEIDADVQKLVDKYRRIMGWDIPEVDEVRGKRLIIDEMRAALERLSAGPA